MIAENFQVILAKLDGVWWVMLNPVMLLGLTAQLTSMVVKGLIKSVKNGKFSMKEMASYGGMPSSHTAFIIAVVLGLGMEYGWTSAAFGFGVVVALIVLVDAVKLRGTIDNINRMTDKLSQEHPSCEIHKPKFVAHTVPEVVGGAVYAVIYTFFFYLFFYQWLNLVK